MAARDGQGRDLEIPDDASFQRREWRVQRVAWILIATVLLLTVGGFAGHGLFSTRHARAPRLDLEYQAFARRQAQTDLTLRIAPSIGDTVVRVLLGRKLVESVDIERIDPEPESVKVGRDHYEYAFARSADDTVDIRIRYKPTAVGPLHIIARIDDQPGIDATQFLYP